MTTSITQPYLDRNDGNALNAAEEFARDLMRGDPETFKAGYSPASAHLATVTAFELTDSDASALHDRLIPA